MGGREGRRDGGVNKVDSLASPGRWERKFKKPGEKDHKRTTKTFAKEEVATRAG